MSESFFDRWERVIKGSFVKKDRRRFAKLAAETWSKLPADYGEPVDTRPLRQQIDEQRKPLPMTTETSRVTDEMVDTAQFILGSTVDIDDMRAALEAAFALAPPVDEAAIRVDAEAKTIERCARMAKIIGETFPLDMTARPDRYDDLAWTRMETIREIVEAIRRVRPAAQTVDV